MPSSFCRKIISLLLGSSEPHPNHPKEHKNAYPNHKENDVYTIGIDYCGRRREKGLKRAV
jgi:hypothetical protein